MKENIRKILPLLILLAASIVLSACGATKTPPREPSGVMDSPEHHYRVGMDFLDKEDLTGAVLEFNTALELDPEYGPALAGKGLVQAMRGEEEDSLDLIEEGQDLAKDDREEMWTLIAEIRAYTALAKNGKMSEEDLIDESEDVFDDAVDIDENDPELYFYQGEAYFTAYDFDNAEKMYLEVLRLNPQFKDGRADERMEMVSKVKRAGATTAVGRRIALVDKITRADMAGLLVEELKVERFYTRTQEPEEKPFEPPQSILMDPQDLTQPVEAVDIKHHPLKHDIEKVIELGVEGLQPYPDHKFLPQHPMAKVEVAMIYQDVIIRATGNTSLATKYIGEVSPFPDIRSDHYAFNAVMLCTTRGLLNSDLRTSLFEPMDPIPGVDAVTSINRLKTQLSVF